MNARAYLEFGEQFTKMSLPERLFNNSAYLLMTDFFDAEVRVLVYEPVSFNVPGGKYTPDFMMIFSDGAIAFIEVKQQAVTRSGKKFIAGKAYRDSRSKLRATAELNPWFKFFQAVYNNKDGWQIEPIVPTRGIENVYIKSGG